MLIRTLFELVGLSRPAKKNAAIERYLKEHALQEALAKEDEAFKILSFGSPDLGTGPTFLEAEIQNGSKQDIALGQFKFFLSYTVNPAGTFMRGGNAILSWDIDLKLRKDSVIPARRVAKVIIYKTGDPIAFIDRDTSRNAGRKGMKRDLNWLREYEMYSQNIFSLLSEIPSSAWLSLRTPAGRNGDFLRSKEFEMPKEGAEEIVPRVSSDT